MNKLILSVIVTGAVMSANSYAASYSNLEERLLLLEQRVKQAESRADSAEEKIRQSDERRFGNGGADNQPETASDTPTLTLTGFNNLKLYGDVELNMDGASRSGQLTSIKTSDDQYWKPGNHERWGINGRLLIGLEGYKRLDNGSFAGFTVQPLANINGDMNVDDAAFFFGEEKNWQVKVGRFEAYDMFPLNQDTFIEYSGNTANDLYSDGYGYIYMMKEGRGRSSSGGGLNLSKNIGNWYLELNTLIEEGTALFVDNRYHGNELTSNKNSVYLRPVIAWKSDAFSAAVAMESNVIKNAWGYKNERGDAIDQSRRNGYGLTLSWNGQATDAQNGVIANFSTALLDAQDEQDFSVGANALWRRFEIGYIYAHNNIEKFNTTHVIHDEDGVFNGAGKYSIHTLHTSYHFPDFMNMKNFNLYLGAYASLLNTADADSDGDTRYGVRARFKYYF